MVKAMASNPMASPWSFITTTSVTTSASLSEDLDDYISCSSEEVLLEKQPRSLNSVAHGLAFSNAASSSSLLKKFLHACPALNKQPNVHGDLPIHMAVASKSIASLAVILSSVTASHSLIFARNLDGATPTHVLADTCEDNLQEQTAVLIIKMLAKCLLKQNHNSDVSDIARAKDSVGRTPMHVAAHAGKPLILQALLDTFQEDDVDAKINAICARCQRGRDVLAEAKRTKNNDACLSICLDVLSKKTTSADDDSILHTTTTNTNTTKTKKNKNKKKKPPKQKTKKNDKPQVKASAQRSSSSSSEEEEEKEEISSPETISQPPEPVHDKDDDDDDFHVVVSARRRRQQRAQSRIDNDNDNNHNLPSPSYDDDADDDDDDDDDTKIPQSPSSSASSSTTTTSSSLVARPDVVSATTRRSAHLLDLEVTLSQILGLSSGRSLSPAQADALRLYHQSALAELDEAQTETELANEAEWRAEQYM